VIDSSTGWITTALAGKQAAGSYLTTTGTAADSAKLGGVAAASFSQTSHTHAFSSLTSKPTTLSGYGITDAASASHAHTQDSISSAAGWITDALAGKQPTITAGTTSQYYRGDKTFQDFATSVRAAILTGLNTSKLSSREVLSTDSLLSAIGLLQGQLTSLVEQNYYAQAGDTKLEIPLSYTGTGTGVLTLRLLSDIAQTATIDGAGKFYSDSAGTLNESTSCAMAANALTTFYIKVPSGTCNVTIPNGYAIRAFGNSANPLVTETNNGPKINGLSTSKIRSDVLGVYLYAQRNLSILSGKTYPWLNSTSVFFNGESLTISGITYPWVNATLVYFLGGAMPISGVTYPWVNATQVYFAGDSLTISGVTYPWVNATLVYFYGNSLTISGVTYPWVNATRVIFLGNSMTITANISTSALYSGTGDFDLYLSGTGVSVTYPTSRSWPVNITRIYIRPSTGSMPSADVDRLFNDLDATPGLTAVGWSKLLDLRGNCGAVTAASATARANLAAKGFTVSFNV